MFHYAALYNLYKHPLIIFLRLVLFLFLFGLFLFSLEQNVSLRLPLGLLAAFAIAEIFFRLKFRTLKPAKTVIDAKNTDVFDTFTLGAAALFLHYENTHAFLAELTRKKEVRFILTKAGIEAHELEKKAVDKEKLAFEALKLAREEQKPYVTVLDIFAAYFLLTETQTKLLFKKELKKNDFLTLVAFAQNTFPEELIVKLPTVTTWGGGVGDEWITGWTLETQKYTQNFTKESLAAQPILVGREKEYEMMVEILLRSSKKNVLLIGQPGVGKKQMVSFFAWESFLGDVPSALAHRRVFELLSGILVAGATSVGELEDRLKRLLDEIAHGGDVMLFIPELQNIAGAGSDNLDITGALLPYLLSGKLSCIATLTPQNFKTYFEKNGSFLEAFEKIDLAAPTKEEAIPMLLDASLPLETKHRVVFSYKAVIAACELSEKYMPGRFLPGKAISLLDEAAAKAVIGGKAQVDDGLVTGLVEEKIHVKVSIPKKEEKNLLLHLEEILHKRVIGQHEAITTVAEALRRLRSGLAFEGRPVGVFLFLGPTGVGKTETAKAVASVYFGSEKAMIRFDMSEYQQREAADRLIDDLCDHVQKQPFSLILLDEFEKAYPSLLDVFLSIFEDGRLTDTQGITVSFENTIIVATSNAGSEIIREYLQLGKDLEKNRAALLDMLERGGVFKPELLNRFDAIVLYHPLDQEEIVSVTKLLLGKVISLLAQKDIGFAFDTKAAQAIAKQGFDPTMGARPLRRFIQDHVEDLLSQKILRDEIKRGDTAVLSADAAGNLTLDVKE